MREIAIWYLEREPICYMDMLEPIRRGTASVVAAERDGGVLLYEAKSGAHMLAADSPAIAETLLRNVEHVTLAATHQDFAAAFIAEKYGLRRTMRCRQTVWNCIQPPSVPETTFAFRALPLDAVEDVVALYSHDVGTEYINERLLAGELFGAFAGDEIAGVIGLHAEGSMGMLEVAPSFRRQGVATQLIAFLSARLLDAGRTPFSQFTVDNIPSQRLHEAMGFSISQDYIHWIEV